MPATPSTVDSRGNEGARTVLRTRTVERHLFEKLSATKRVQLAVAAFRAGLVE